MILSYFASFKETIEPGEIDILLDINDYDLGMPDIHFISYFARIL